MNETERQVQRIKRMIIGMIDTRTVAYHMGRTLQDLESMHDGDDQALMYDLLNVLRDLDDVAGKPGWYSAAEKIREWMEAVAQEIPARA